MIGKGLSRMSDGSVAYQITPTMIIEPLLAIFMKFVTLCFVSSSPKLQLSRSMVRRKDKRLLQRRAEYECLCSKTC